MKRPHEDDDDIDDEEDEMSKLRQSKKFSAHANTYGRAQAKEVHQQKQQQQPEPMDEEEQLRAFFPSDFGKKYETIDKDAVIEKTKKEGVSNKVLVGPARPSSSSSSSSSTTAAQIPQKPEHEQEGFVGPPRPAPRSSSSNDDDDDNDDSDDDDDDNIPSGYLQEVQLPVTHEIELSGYSKAVNALGIDPAGARLATGGSDGFVKLWDFAGMDSSLRCFRDIEPCPGHQIKSLQYSNTGDRILVASGSAQAKIIDRDAFELAEFVKGDQYLADMGNTKGHVSAISNAMWHPLENDKILTSSIDGTMRLWDVKDTKKHKSILRAKNTRGTRTGVVFGMISPDAKFIAAACQDGSLQIWQGKGPYSKANIIVREAHEPTSSISCLSFSADGLHLVSRGCDDTLKVWDTRNFKTPIKVVSNLPNHFEQTDVIFSPDEDFIITGTSAKKGSEGGSLVFFDRHSLEPVKQLGMGGASVVRVTWNKSINQIFVGCSDGKTRVLYDPAMSKRGALLCVAKRPRKSDPSDDLIRRPIHVPNALEMFEDQPTGKRKREKDRKDPIRHQGTRISNIKCNVASSRKR
eukprot:TRINITY_DN1818_c0_g1_i1.p1 TRINITY_DN1818_c0_g1~~TRINITY_DN1818_c0_g1_i1.p1  ORF type:complete len:576 (+),score=191.52 TRINITY_DN1818_c0_g1_i1:29-1756(+)